MRILVLNTYSFDKIYQEWLDGESPSHFLFGTLEVNKHDGFQADILPHSKYKWLNKIGDFIGLTGLDQQVRVLMQIRKYDIIYAPFALGNTRLLNILKYFRIINTPIVILGHMNLYIKPEKPVFFDFRKKLLLDYNKIAFLSEGLMNKTINDLGVSKSELNDRFTKVNWGADVNFHKKNESYVNSRDTQFAICAGTTDRDFELVIEAFREIDFPLEIYCTPATRPNDTNLPDHISINSDFVPYIDLLRRYQKARFILIPIKKEKVETGRTLGLTVLLDSLAINKPAIMTYNKYVDINPEDHGFGLSVHGFTVEEWRKAINSILFDFEKLDKMASNANALYVSEYNSERFGDSLVKVFKEIK
ncbi:glycosyltransferase family 1 protein [Belliella marina]|uniref:Glycosyltransferase family 1 protein n=1 Tax=Belliella marina TaxID=1644146 RepID=A0ABW4VM17_9BACT